VSGASTVLSFRTLNLSALVILDPRIALTLDRRPSKVWPFSDVIDQTGAWHSEPVEAAMGRRGG
jgi:hypothetical protein